MFVIYSSGVNLFVLGHFVLVIIENHFKFHMCKQFYWLSETYSAYLSTVGSFPAFMKTEFVYKITWVDETSCVPVDVFLYNMWATTLRNNASRYTQLTSLLLLLSQKMVGTSRLDFKIKISSYNPPRSFCYLNRIYFSELQNFVKPFFLTCFSLIRIDSKIMKRTM